MNEHESVGRTVEEAIDKALSSLGIRKDNAEITVIEEPSQGLLGLIGSKNAKVVVRKKYEPYRYLENYIIKLLELMEVPGKVEVSEDDSMLQAMITGDDVGILIGRRGKTLSELQYLVNIVVRRQFPGLNKMVVLDVEYYRAKREKTLAQLAVSVARKVSRDGYEQALEPMSPQERRVIHLALQDYPGVTTYSEGQDPYRKVVVAPR